MSSTLLLFRLERNQRCNYFKWSSDIPETLPDSGKSHHENHEIIGRDDANNIFSQVQTELQSIFSGGLEEGFCGLINSQFEKNQGSATAPDVTLSSDGASDKPFPSIMTASEKRQDMDDGLYRALEKLGKSKPSTASRSDADSLSSASVDSTSSAFLCSSLDLFSLLAPKRQASRDTPSWSLDWFSVLCEIISTGTSNTQRQLAKTMLQRLCGGLGVYQRVRDHYVFGFQVSSFNTVDAAAQLCALTHSPLLFAVISSASFCSSRRTYSIQHWL